MDRVLKRVGLSKRTQSDADVYVTNLEENVKFRRRRRSKSRRRNGSDNNKKCRGIFNIDWESVKDCKSCKSRAITKRFCNKRADNELYRSNSFKFERFIRGNDDLSTLSRKISLCEDYSLPADHLNKKRPNSIAVPNCNFISNPLSEWSIVSSPNEDKVEVLDTYSTPRDSQIQLTQEDEAKCFTSPDKEYSQPYTTEESSNPSSDNEFGEIGGQNASAITRPNPLDLNSPDSINEGAVAPASVLDVLSPNKTETNNSKRHPSPYYYGDLFKYKTTEISPPKRNVKKSQSLRPERNDYHKQQSSKKVKSNRKYRKTTADNANESQEHTGRTTRSKPSIRHKKSSSNDSHSTDSRDAPRTKHMPPNRVNVLPDSDDGLDDMTRQRHVYETAFDCRVNKSDDDLDQIDKVSNHPVLVQINSAWDFQPILEPSISRTKSQESNKKQPSHTQEDNNSKITNISKGLKNMHLANEDNISSSSALPLRGYTPSPPSTAPLPTKFPGKELMMNSIRSAPNLPSKYRIKDLHQPVKSLRGRTGRQGNAFEIEFGSTTDSNKLISEFKGRPGSSREQTQGVEKDNRIYEIQNRPKRDLLILPKRAKDTLTRRIRHKYSSTESMTTSSSGGSMESIKSSTSEGNRSTSSSESRQSASLSSHSSDSGGNRLQTFTTPQSNFLVQQPNTKLHILSPISDKSSQEPISETSDNNRNNNSQKCSPEIAEETAPTEIKIKRRFPQNKNLLSLGLQDRPEIQGSDSGISIHSREGIKSRFTELSAPPSQQDFSELPFDMPKLRRRRMIPDSACTSGSATSVDLRDLPFDMPKLRRRMRLQTCNLEDSVSQASSSQSVMEADRASDKALCRPKLTLNLGEIGLRQRTGLGLTLTGIGFNFSTDGASTSQYDATITNANDSIDINLPLEKQGWFHGSITRVEAENVLKVLREGSFLVRNSESIKNDYSLSLKSARGFMHMRIQKNGADGCFILGQFSKPFTSIPEMIKHFSLNRLPIRGAEHMCLLQPVIAQLL